MSAEFKTQTIADQPIMTSRMTFPAQDVAEKLKSMLAETYSVLRSAGAEAAGKPFAIYHAFDSVFLDVESGVPVSRLVADSGNIKGRVLPGGLAVTASHTGPYHELINLQARLNMWMEQSGHEADGPVRFVYLNDPETVSGPDAYQTSIIQPVKSAT